MSVCEIVNNIDFLLEDGVAMSSVRVAKKEQGGSAVLPSVAHRADSGGEVLGAPPASGFGECCKLPSRIWAEPWALNDFSVLWGLQAAYFAMFLRETSCRNPLIWQQVGCANPPGGQKLYDQGGYHL